MKVSFDLVNQNFGILRNVLHFKTKNIFLTREEYKKKEEEKLAKNPRKGSYVNETASEFTENQDDVKKENQIHTDSKFEPSELILPEKLNGVDDKPVHIEIAERKLSQSEDIEKMLKEKEKEEAIKDLNLSDNHSFSDEEKYEKIERKKSNSLENKKNLFHLLAGEHQPNVPKTRAKLAVTEGGLSLSFFPVCKILNLQFFY